MGRRVVRWAKYHVPVSTFTQAVIVPAGSDHARAKQLLEKAEKGCPVSNSLTAVKHIEAEIVEAA